MSPYHSQGNGKAESAVRISKIILKKSRHEDPYLALLAYQNTPQQGYDYSPAEFKDGKCFAVRPVAVHISCHIPLVNQIAISKKSPFVCVRNGWIVPLKQYLEQRKLNFGCIAYNVHNSDNPLILIWSSCPFIVITSHVVCMYECIIIIGSSSSCSVSINIIIIIAIISIPIDNVIVGISIIVSRL